MLCALNSICPSPLPWLCTEPGVIEGIKPVSILAVILIPGPAQALKYSVFKKVEFF